MKNITIEISKDKVNEEGEVFNSHETVKINLPISWWSAKEHRGFSIFKNGLGSYSGMSQMFGGPKGGELVCFDRGVNEDLIAIMTGMTQDWDTRKGSLEFVCVKRQFWDRVKNGLLKKGILNPESSNDIFKHTNKIFGFDEAVDMQFKIAKYHISKFILSK